MDKHARARTRTCTRLACTNMLAHAHKRPLISCADSSLAELNGTAELLANLDKRPHFSKLGSDTTPSSVPSTVPSSVSPSVPSIVPSISPATKTMPAEPVYSTAAPPTDGQCAVVAKGTGDSVSPAAPPTDAPVGHALSSEDSQMEEQGAKLDDRAAHEAACTPKPLQQKLLNPPYPVAATNAISTAAVAAPAAFDPLKGREGLVAAPQCWSESSDRSKRPRP